MNTAPRLVPVERESETGLGIHIGNFELMRQVDINPDHSRVFLAMEEATRRKLRVTIHDPRVAVDAFGRHLVDMLHRAAEMSHPSLLPIESVIETEGLIIVSSIWPEAWSLRDVLRAYNSRRGSVPDPLLAAIGLQLQDLLNYLGAARSRTGLPLSGTSGNMGLDTVALSVDGHVLHLGIPHVSVDDVATLRPPPEVVAVLARLAPEQLRSFHSNARSDVHGLGILLSSLLLGYNPVERKTAEATRAAVRSGAELGPLLQCDPGLAAALRHAVAPTLEKRDTSVVRLGRALDRARYGHGSELTRKDLAEVVHDLFGGEGEVPTPPAVEDDDEFLALLATRGRPAAPVSAPAVVAAAPTAQPAVPTPEPSHVGPSPEAPLPRRSILPTVLGGSALLVSLLVAALVVSRMPGPEAEPPAAVAASEVAAPAAPEPAAAQPAGAPTEVQPEQTVSSSPAPTFPMGISDAEAQARAEEARARAVEARAEEAKARAEEAKARAAEAKGLAAFAAANQQAPAPASAAVAAAAPVNEPVAMAEPTSRVVPPPVVPAAVVATPAPRVAAAAPVPDRPAIDRAVGAGLPRTFEARSPQDLARALGAIEEFAVKAGVPASVARGATAELGSQLIASYIPSESIMLYPRASFGWIVDAAEASKSAGSIRTGLVRAHNSGALK